MQRCAGLRQLAYCCLAPRRHHLARAAPCLPARSNLAAACHCDCRLHDTECAPLLLAAIDVQIWRQAKQGDTLKPQYLAAQQLRDCIKAQAPAPWSNVEHKARTLRFYSVPVVM